MDKNNIFDVWGQYAEAQKNMMDMWSKMFAQPLQKEETTPVANPMDWFNPMKSSLANSFFAYEGSPFELYEKISQGTSAYAQLYQLWQDLYRRKTAPTKEAVETMMNDWTKKSRDMAQRYFLPLFPQEMQAIMNELMQASVMYRDSFKKHMEPWQQTMRSFAEAMGQDLMTDPNVFLAHYQDWEKTYKDTFGKMLNMPMMGISREKAEAQLKALDRYMTMLGSLSQLLAKVTAIANENTKRIIKQCVEDIQAGSQPKTFDEFYLLWKNSLSAAFDDLFYSDEFSKMLADMVDAIMEFKIAMNTAWEKSLSGLPIPLKSDMDSLYKSVYELKREVRAMKKKVATLESDLDKEKK